MIDRGMKAESELRKLQAEEEAQQIKETGKAKASAQKKETRDHHKHIDKQPKTANVKKSNHHIQQPVKKSS